MIKDQRPWFADWLDHPVYVVAAAFLAGVIMALIIVLIVRSGDGDDNPPRVVATSTARQTAATSQPGRTATRSAAGTPAPQASPSGTGTPERFDDPDDALAEFLRVELNESYIGPCPEEIGPEGPPSGLCSVELYRSEDLVTFGIGPPFSEGIGEAVLTPREDGTWAVDFIRAPAVGEGELSVGAQAVVLGAGDCLNFRDEPSTSAEALSCQLDGARAEVLEGPVEADGITWWELEGLGWASAEFLAPAP